MNVLHREIRQRRQQVQDERAELGQRLRATERLVSRRVASPLGLAAGFGGGVLLGMLRPDRLLTTRFLRSALTGAFLKGARAALSQARE